MGKVKAGGGTLYLIVRLGWRDRYHGGYDWFRDPDGDPYTDGRPVAAYGDRKAAEARCAALEAEARAGLNPFAFFEDYWLRDYSSLSPGQFRERLRQLLPGVRLPGKNKYGGREWLPWWERVVDRLTDEQRQAVWGLLNHVRFYAVTSTRLKDS
jgi:hypothetical protein